MTKVKNDGKLVGSQRRSEGCVVVAASKLALRAEIPESAAARAQESPGPLLE